MELQPLEAQRPRLVAGEYLLHDIRRQQRQPQRFVHRRRMQSLDQKAPLKLKARFRESFPMMDCCHTTGGGRLRRDMLLRVDHY